MEQVQPQFVVPALAWTWLCPIVLWWLHPSKIFRSILWATVIAFLISKIVCGFLTVLDVFRVHGAASSWVIGYIGEAGNFDFFLIFGPSVIWGLIMGLRRWQYLRNEQVPPSAVRVRAPLRSTVK
jgi:hypothetical protein